VIEFLKKLWASLDTPEGVAVVVAIVWSALVKWAGLPEAVTIPGIPGEMSPAALLLISVPLVIAKMGWTVPFQPVTALHGTTTASNGKGGGIGLIGMAFVAVLMCGAASPAVAGDISGDVLDLDRLSVGANVGAAYTEPNDAAQPVELGMRGEGFLSGTVSDQLSLVAKGGGDFTHSRYFGSLGARGAVYGHESLTNENRFVAGLSFERVYWWGSGAEAMTAKEDWYGGVNLAWIAVPGVFADGISTKLQVRYGEKNGFDTFLALGASF